MPSNTSSKSEDGSIVEAYVMVIMIEKVVVEGGDDEEARPVRLWPLGNGHKGAL